MWALLFLRYAPVAPPNKCKVLMWSIIQHGCLWHLKAKHANEFNLHMKALDDKAKEKMWEASRFFKDKPNYIKILLQLFITESREHIKLEDIMSNDARGIHYTMGQMIVKDVQP